MNHTIAWQLVGGDVLIFLAYGIPPFLYMTAGLITTDEDRSPVVGFVVLFLATIINIISHLISSGTIK